MRIFFCLVCFSLFLSICVYGQSDGCATATPITIPASGNICATYTSVGGTADNVSNGCNGNVSSNYVWFQYVVAGSQNTIVVTPTTLQDAAVVVDVTSCADASIDFCNNSAGTSPVSIIRSYAVGTTVLIGVSSTSGVDGSFQICVTSQTPTSTAAGDDCSNAIPVCSTTPVNIPSMAAFTGSTALPSCFFDNPSQDAWVTFTALTSGTVRWTANPTSNSTEFDWAMYNSTASCPGTVVSCNYNFDFEIGSNFGMNAGGGGEFNAGVNVTAGQTYSILINNWSGDGTGFVFTWGNGTAQIAPNVAFTLNPSTVVCGASTTVTINNTSVGSPDWTFGNGSTYTGAAPPSQTYTTPGTYAITGTISGACPSTFTQYVNLFGPITATPVIASETCNNCNGGIQLTNVTGGDGTFTYAWSPGGATTPTLSNQCAGTYSVTISDGTCPPATINAIVIPSSPQPSINGTLTTCTGQTTALSSTSTPAAVNPWTSSSTAIATISNTGVVTGVAPGTSTITFTDNTGCQNTATVTVTNLSTPTFTQLGPYCQGATAGALPSSSLEGFTGTWNPTTISTAVLGNQTYTFTPSIGQCASQATLVISTTVQSAPVFTAVGPYCANSVIPALPTTSNDGIAGTWSPAINNAATTTYTFTPGAGQCASTTTLSITINPIVTPTFPQLGPYCINAVIPALPNNSNEAISGTWSPALDNTVTTTYTFTPDAGLCASTTTMTITVNGVTLSETHQDVLCFGQSTGSIDLTVNGGQAPITFGWSNSGFNEDLNSVPAGNYICNVTDNGGCTASITVNLTEPNSAVNVTETHVDATCFGYCDGTVNITASGGTAPYSYLWAPGNTTVEDPTGLCAGSYGVIVTDDNGCPFTLPVSISEPAQGINVTGIITDASCNGICDGLINITATGGSGVFSYSWDYGVGNTEDPTNVCAGTYTVTVTDATGVCSFDQTYTVNEPPAVTVSVSNDQSICVGNTSSLQGNGSGGDGGPYTYFWTSNPADPSISSTIVNNPTVSPATTTTYTVTATDGNNCNSSPTAVTITVAEPLTLSLIVAGANPICEGQTSSLVFTATGGDGNYVYSLVGGGVVQSPLTVNPTTTTTYEIFVTDGCSSPADTSSATINVNPLPNILLTSPDTAGCEDFRADFIGSTDNVSGVLWDWNFGDPSSNSNQETTAPIGSNTHIYELPGTYTVTLTVTSADNCVNTAVFQNFIVVHPEPTASFAGTPTVTDILNPNIVFIDQSSLAAEWYYDFFDGTSSNEQNPTHTYPDTGTFTVQQIVTTEFGCTDDAFYTVFVTPVYNLYVPNTFSPNGNRENDVFNAKGEGYDPGSYELKVFNRWGEMVFRTKSLEHGWDGTKNGTECAQGVYSYVLTIKSLQDYRQKTFFGHVTLLR